MIYAKGYFYPLSSSVRFCSDYIALAGSRRDIIVAVANTPQEAESLSNWLNESINYSYGRETLPGQTSVLQGN
jgi:hypothetical protein